MGQATSSYERGDYESALSAYQQAKQRAPNDPQVMILIGRTLSKLCRFSEAIESYDRFRALDPTPAPEVEARLQQYIRDAREQRGCTRPLAPPPGPKPETARPTPVYKRGWFWGVLGGSVAAIALGVGLGVGLGRGAGEAAVAPPAQVVAVPVPWQ